MAVTFTPITNRKTISPLFLYTKQAIDTHSVNPAILTKAKAAIDNAVDNCCFPRHKVTKNVFLNTFYAMLNGMTRKFNLQKLIAIQRLINNKVYCCDIELGIDPTA